VRIVAVVADSRLRAFRVRIGRAAYRFPFTSADPVPTSSDPVADVAVDPELDRRGFTYRLASGKEGSILSEQVLEYNDDPRLLRDRTLHLLTVEAIRRAEDARVSKRELIRRLGTSASQFYRLLDPTNYRKSVDQMLALLHVLGCEVDIVVRAKSA
jgi:hypothetical protein